jgi:nitroreductase
MDYEDLLELVRNRRSIRRYKPDPIPNDYIDKIIEVARWAPSAFNTQPWEFVVIKNQGFKDEIAKYIYQAWKEANTDDVGALVGGPADFSSAPVFIILYGDMRTKDGLPEAAQAHAFEKLFISSLANAFLYMHLAATSLGLASQWVSQIALPSVDQAVKELLGIPEALKASEMMALGYAAVKARPKFIRPKEKMVHEDYCGTESFRSDAEVIDYAKRTKTWAIATHRRLPDK